MRVRKAAKKKAAKKKVARAAGPPEIGVPAPRMVRLDTLNEAPYNPRFIGDEEMASLKASLRRHGFVEPMVVQERGSVLIAGHQRLRALREMARDGQAVVPDEVSAVVLDVDDGTAKQLNVTLNRVGGEFDAHRLGLVLADVVRLPGYDPVAIGFRREEVDELVRQSLATPEDLARKLEESVTDLGGFARSVTLTVPFPTTEDRDRAKALLAELGGRGVEPGRLLLKLLRQHRSLSRKAS